MLDFKRLRVDVGMTQSAVADKLGVTLRTYQRMEKDPEALSQKDLQKIMMEEHRSCVKMQCLGSTLRIVE